MAAAKPVADYTPCETCAHPKALHSARGCHVITDNRATKRQPNVTCDCRIGQATINSELTVANSAADELSRLVDQQQQWVKEHS